MTWFISLQTPRVLVFIFRGELFQFYVNVSGHLSDAEQRQMGRTFEPLCCVYSGDCAVPGHDMFWFELEFSLARGAEG